MVLFETGMNPEVRRDPIGYWGTLARKHLVPVLPDGATGPARATAGMRGDLRYVVNSHLHNDHAGMNTAFDRSLAVRASGTRTPQHSWPRPPGYVRNDFTDGGEVRC
jgi:glyoxylase-like metal-dependent hydrolase (beta-lactamase superfamily II)